jgi:hypothetical protein
VAVGRVGEQSLEQVAVFVCVGVAAAGAVALAPGVDVRGRCVGRAEAVGDAVARAERDPLGSTSQSAGAQSALRASEVAPPLWLT